MAGIDNMTTDVIQALTTEYVNVYSLNIRTDEVVVHRFAGQAVGVLEQLDRKSHYDEIMQAYIEQNVHPEDVHMFRWMSNKSKIVRELTYRNVYVVHYRIRRKGEVHYYFMKCVRVGQPESFDTVILAFANEDAQMYFDQALSNQIPGEEASKRMILLVEQNDQEREQLCSILESAYEVVEAENYTDGFELLQEHYRQLSMIILNSEGSKGIKFLESVRQIPLLTTVPVVVITDTAQDAELYLKLGAADFIPHPYNAGVVLRRVASSIRLNEFSVTLHAVEYDVLTGVYTREAFCHHAENMLRRNPDVRYDMVMSDVENFKRINERYGNAMGDRILKMMGSVLANSNPEVLCGRFGSDRFVAILRHTEANSVDGLESLARRLPKGLPVPNVTVKFAVYDDVDHHLPASVLCDRLTTALATVKHQYGKYCARYDERMKKQAEQEILIEESMQRALDEGQFRVYFQPKHDLRTGRTGGAEALVRWFHPELGFLSPAVFIPVFEKTGFITQLDQYVWTEVCRTLTEWRLQGAPVVPISVNVSRRDFDKEDLVEGLVHLADRFGLAHELLHIEVTESSFAMNPKRVTDVINGLHRAGFIIEMDDFGVGYSSLSSVSSLPLDVLKLDRSILNQPASERSILNFAVQLARAMNLTTVQEGVETEEQLERVKKLGCDYVQGYHFSKPLPRAQFEAYLAAEYNL